MSPFPRSGYETLSVYAPDRRPVAVDLCDNTNLWGPHPAALAALHAAAGDDLARYPSVSADRLRAAISRRFDVPLECVTTGCGSDDILDSTFRVAGEPGEAVRFPTPTFSMIDPLARMNGLAARPGPDTTRLGATDPAALVQGAPALVYLCRPNNPTGELVDRSWVAELLEAGGPRGPLVVVDEAYADFAGDSMIGQAAASDRLLVVRTLSKAFGLAGLRVGFAVGPPAVVGEIEKSRGPYKVSRAAENAAVRALEDESGWVDEVVRHVRASREQLIRELEARALGPLPSAANFVLLPAGPRGSVGLTAALREREVAVRPFPELPEVGDAVRITVGPWPVMERLLETLDEVMEP